MELWVQTCCLLCAFGFIKELRPSESFLTEYLLGPPVNLTESELYFDVYPVWTYSYLSLLFVIFLVTDLLRYKPVIVLEGFALVATWCLLLWARGVYWMQFMQFTYGLSCATEVAYYSYIYAQVDYKYFQKVSGYTRGSFLAGRFLAGILGQILISFNFMDYHELNYISLSSVIVALLISFTLPPVTKSIYFHRNNSDSNPENSDVNCKKDFGHENADFKIENGFQQENNDSHCKNDFQQESGSQSNREGLPQKSVIDIYENDSARQVKSLDMSSRNEILASDDHSGFSKKIKKVSKLLWFDFKDSYSNSTLLKWSIWWAFATCINFQVGNYIQPLWETVRSQNSNDAVYNGAAEALSTLLGSLAAFSIGYIHLNWDLVGELTLAVISLIDAILLCCMGLFSNVYVAYINYVIFRVSYQVLITVATAQVAKLIRAECYALVFGVNMFAALLFQTILTVIVADWLQIDPGVQFVIYGCYFLVLSLLFFGISVYGLSRLGCSRIRRERIWLNEEQEEN